MALRSISSDTYFSTLWIFISGSAANHLVPLAFTFSSAGSHNLRYQSLGAHAPVHRGSDPEPGKGLNMFVNERLQGH